MLPERQGQAAAAGLAEQPGPGLSSRTRGSQSVLLNLLAGDNEVTLTA